MAPQELLVRDGKRSLAVEASENSIFQAARRRPKLPVRRPLLVRLARHGEQTDDAMEAASS